MMNTSSPCWAHTMVEECDNRTQKVTTKDEQMDRLRRLEVIHIFVAGQLGFLIVSFASPLH